MSIKVTTNFFLATKEHLDKRAICDTLAELQALDLNKIPYGMLTFCLEDENTYRLCKGDIWEKVIINGTLGKPPDIEKFIYEINDTGNVDTTKPLFVKEGEIEVHTKDDVHNMIGASKDILDQAGNLIDDNNITDDKTWSSKKIYDQLQVILESGKKYSDEQMSAVIKPPFEIVTSEDDMILSDRFYLLNDGGGNFNIYAVGNDSSKIKISNTSIDLSAILTIARTDEVNEFLLDKPTNTGVENQIIQVNDAADGCEWRDNINLSKLLAVEYLKDIEKLKIPYPLEEGEADQYLTIGEDKNLSWSGWDSIFCETIEPDESNVYNLTQSEYQLLINAPEKFSLSLPTLNSSTEISLYIMPTNYVTMKIPDTVTMMDGDTEVDLCKRVTYKLVLKYVKDGDLWFGKLNEYNKSPNQIAYFTTTDGVNALSTEGSESVVRTFKNGKQISVIAEDLTQSVNMQFTNLNNVTNIVIDGGKFSVLKFNGCSNLESVTIRNANLTTMVDFSRMFMDCPKLTSLSFDGIDIRYGIKCDYMFTNTENIKPSDISMTNCFEGFQNTIKNALSPSIKVKYTTNSNPIKIISNSNMTSNVTTDGYTIYSFEGQSPITLLNTSGNTSIAEIIISNATINNTCMGMFDGCTSMTTVNFNSVYFAGAYNMSNMFKGCSKLVNTNMSGLDISMCTNTACMFYECKSLTTLNLSNWDTSNITYMFGMFHSCYKLATVYTNNWDTSKVTDMSYMFANCSPLTTMDASEWDTGNVTNMQAMFYGCKSLYNINVDRWNTSKVNDMSYMFYNCNNLNTLSARDWDTGNVTTMYDMFYGCSKLTTLNASKWNTSNVTSMQGMFGACSSLTTLDVSNWNTSNVTSMRAMFSVCNKLTTLDVSNWDTSKVNDMYWIFNECNALETLNTANWDLSSLTDMRGMFRGCRAIQHATLNNIGKGVNSLEDVFNSCQFLFDTSLHFKEPTSIYSLNTTYYYNLNVRSIKFTNMLLAPSCNIKNVFDNTVNLKRANIVLNNSDSTTANLITRAFNNRKMQ